MKASMRVGAIGLSLLGVCGGAMGGSDFNGDGKDDLAIGVPGEDLGGISNCGMVNIVLGGTTMSPQALELDPADFGLARETSGEFGAALACGDFDGDGVDDLAVGAPRQDAGGDSEAGVVCVIFGLAGSGLNLSRTMVLHQDVPNVDDASEPGDHFGKSLCAGDFNGDGIDDLVVGVPDENVGAVTDAGLIHVFPGRLGVGPDASREFDINQDSTSATDAILDAVEAGDRYGAALCAVDFDGDGLDDLAVGIPEENMGSVVDAGAVNVIFSIDGIGLGFLENTFLVQGSALFTVISSDFETLNQTSETGDNFGASIAGGVLSVPSRATIHFLAAGIPGKTVLGQADAGAVGIITMDEDNPMKMRYINQDGGFLDDFSVDDTAEANERFGASVAVGDFNNDGLNDVAAGVPAEDTAAQDNGGVHVFNGQTAGGVASILFFMGLSDRLITQDTSGIEGVAEAIDFFGNALVAGDFLAGNTIDLAVGVMFESIEASNDISAGAVAIIPGSNGGLTGSGDQLFTQDTPGMGGVADTSDAFGFALGRR